LTAQKANNRLEDVKAKQKRVTASANYRQEARRVRTADSQASARNPRESRKLLVKAFNHPEGSSERRQVFSEYLNALHDEHAK
jgi:predicted nucleic acid-binding Zn ribbon protein